MMPAVYGARLLRVCLTRYAGIGARSSQPIYGRLIVPSVAWGLYSAWKPRKQAL